VIRRAEVGMIARAWEVFSGLFRGAGYEDFERSVYRFAGSHGDEAIAKYCAERGVGPAQIEAFQTLARCAREKGRKAFEALLEEADRTGVPALPFEWGRSGRLAGEQAASARQLDRMISGKRVILVGPADYTVGSGKGSFVESFDWVARVNFQWPVPERLRPDLGSRMDLLYHCCNGDHPVRALFRDGFEETRFVCMERHIQSLELKRHCRSCRIPCLYVSDVYRSLSRKLGARPSTGLVAIEHLLSLPIAELYVFGMTFWRTPYYAGYQGDGAQALAAEGERRVLPHDPEREARYAGRLAKREPRLRLDAGAGI